MDASVVRSKLTGVSDRLAELGVASLWLFGSVAKGNCDEDSDLDILVEFEGPATFSRYMDLSELLEGEFQCRIDLVTARALKPVLRDSVFAEAIKVA